MTKIDVIRNNAHKYSVSAMYDVLNIPRSTYYYQMSLREKDVQHKQEEVLMTAIESIFKASRK